ncbi:MAG: DNA polymerase IV [Gammaproteobacteria bacterium]|nr:DNA polymerase IV [Gammaproteobacteria bacterium]
MNGGRKVIHIDMDCFYAAIEMRDDPRLRGRPMAVGGRPDRRGVISTSNYEARAYGVRSAMASSQALRQCPDLIIVTPTMEKYAAESRRIRGIFAAYAERIEPLSFDEAFLDVTGSAHYQGSATLIAREIRERIFRETQLTASAGIAPNKFLAKIASDWRKPNGQFVVRPEEVDEFVRVLPVEKIFGVGKVTAAKMHELGLMSCGDVRAWSLAQLVEKFGSFGVQLYRLCRGIDERPVVSERMRKSLSVENTYDKDLPDVEACVAVLPELFGQLLERLQRSGDAELAHKLFVKLKFSDFSQTTMECLASQPELERATQLLREAHARIELPVRLVGVGVRFREPASEARQLSFQW